MSKSKFTYPKCPYCKAEYREGFHEHNLMKLATEGWQKECNVTCNSCRKKFKVSIHITYYGSKLNEVQNGE